MSNLPDRGDGNFKSGILTPNYQAKLSYKDLSVTGRTWTYTLMRNLLDIKKASMPVVHADTMPLVYAELQQVPPKKPPLMKYEDLPVQERNEFYEYHTYQEEKRKCPGADEKIIQSFLFPIVHRCRKMLAESVFGMTHELGLMKNEACEATCKNIRCFKKFMRHPDNLMIRRGVLVLGTVTGVYVGSGKTGVLKKLFFGTLGALAAGSLCFPKETDEIFRNTSYQLLQIFIVMYNSFCGKDFALKDRIPCPSDLPPEVSPKKANEINKACIDEKELKAKAEAKVKAEMEAKAKATIKAANKTRCRNEQR